LQLSLKIIINENKDILFTFDVSETSLSGDGCLVRGRSSGRGRDQEDEGAEEQRHGSAATEAQGLHCTSVEAKVSQLQQRSRIFSQPAV